MLENLVVGIVVASAFAYAVWSLMPGAARRRFIQRLVTATGGPESTGLLARLARRLERAAGGGAHCAGCDAHSPPSSKQAPPGGPAR